MTMRLDIVTNDAGENVRREHARDLGAGALISVYRLAKLAQLHNLTNKALLQQIDATHHIIGDYCLRAGANVNILFAQRAVFVAGQLLKGSRAVYDHANELGEIMDWLGGSELTIARDVTREEIAAFAECISIALNSNRGTFVSPTPRIRIRAVPDAARLRGLEVEDLDQDQKTIRTYASAVVIMRRFFEDLSQSRYIMPHRIKRVAQSLVDLSDGATPSFLGVTEARNANHDEAGRAVNSAILAVTISRETTQDRVVLAQIAMAAMMHDVGRPRALALAQAGGGGFGAAVATLSEDQEDRLAAGTSAVLVALGRVNEPTITRTVIAFEALWLRRQQWLGQLYRGQRLATIHARAIQVARRYNDLLTPEPGLPTPTTDYAVATLDRELATPEEKTVLRMLVAALGLVPKGTVVQLSTGEVGEVLASGLGAGDPPVVRLVMDAKGAVVTGKQEIDLGRRGPNDPVRTIAHVLSTDGWSKSLADGPGQGGYDSSPPPPMEEDVPVHVSQPPAVAPAPVAAYAPPVREAERPAEPVERARWSPNEGPPSHPSFTPSGEVRKDEWEDVAGDVEEVTEDDDAIPSPGSSPSAVAEAMGHMINDGLRPTAAPQDDRTVMQSPLDELPEAGHPPPPLEPTARGDLASTPLPHVLVYMLDHGLTGSVVFQEPDGVEHVLNFIEGVPSKARHGGSEGQLGQVLASAGALDPAEIDGHVDGARRLGVLLGEYLVGNDLVSRQMLAWAVETQLLERIANLANLQPATTYSYYRDHDVLASWGGADVPIKGALNGILAAVRTWNDRARVHATLNRIGRHALAIHPRADIAALLLAPDEEAVVQTMRAERITLPELGQRQVADAEVVSSLVYALAITRQFAFPGQKKDPMAALPAPPPEAESATHIAVAAHFPPAQPAPPKPQPRPEPVRREAPAPPPARVAPAPRAPVVAPAAIAPGPASGQAARRGPVIRPAAGAPAIRPVIQKRGAVQGAVAQAAAPARSPSTAPAAMPPSPAPAQASPASLVAPAGPQAKFPSTLQGMPVSKAVASPPSSKQAAPLPRPAAGAPPRPQIAPRPAVAPAAPQPPAPPRQAPRPVASDPSIEVAEVASEAEPALEAMANFRMAEAALARNDTASAEKLAKKAVDGDPTQLEYVALLAWIRALRSSDPRTIDASIATITDVLAAEPELVRALLYRAKLYKRRHDAAAALADLDALLAVDPAHKEAQNEVRALRVKK